MQNQIIDKITMIYVAVGDVEKSKDFYSGKLGLKVLQDHSQGDMRWVSLGLSGGGATITLSNYYGNTKPGMMNIYFSTADIDAACKQVNASGIKLVNPITDDLYGPGSGVKWFRLNDPDGNVLTVAQSKG